MKKILIFSLAYYPSHVSGAEAAVKEITDRISENDYQFHLITLRFDTKTSLHERIGNVDVHRLGVGGKYLSKILFIPYAAWYARTLHSKEQFSGMWALMTYMIFPVTLTRFLGTNIPYFITLQDGDTYEKVFGRWFIRPLLPLLNSGFKHATLIQVISSYLGTWPQKRGYRGTPILIHNGANPKDLHESVPQQDIESIHARLGKKAGDIWLVNTARLVHQKANDITIRALANLPEHFKFVIVGGGPDEAMLRELVKELGVTERVYFIGQVDRSEVTAYRKASDIFVGPSRSEGLGNAFLSAMASRLPVVTTQVGGLADFIFDEAHNSHQKQTAWVVQPDVPDDIVRAIQNIINDTEKVHAVSEYARAMVLEKYDWNIIASQMQEKIFNPLTNGNHETR